MSEFVGVSGNANDCIGGRENNMSTLKDVAKKAGVSISTVSRALADNSHIGEKTKERIRQIADELEYSPNYIARSLKSKGSMTLAYLIPDIENLLYPSLAVAVEKQARALGYSLLLCNTFDDPDLMNKYVRQLQSRFVDGFLFSTSLRKGLNNEAITYLKSLNYPCVSLMRNSPDNTDSVIVDNTLGAEKAVDFLVAQGHREIVFIAGSDNLELYQERFAGYKKGLNKHSIPYSDDLVWPGFNGTQRIVSQVAKEKIESGICPKAIFCASDPLAIDLLKTLHDCKLSVPDQVSVIGFDNLRVSEIFYPSLTTIEQPFFEMGKAAVKLLVAQIENPNKRNEPNLIFETKVIVRESVKLSEVK